MHRTIILVRRAAVAVSMAVALWMVPSGAAQQAPEKGMVWTADGDTSPEASLREMRRSGVEAVRTDPVRDEALLDMADTLGISLYIDLPISRLPAERLVDTLQYARSVLDTVLALARDHASIRAIGLARYSDTSDPTACVFMEELARRIREAGPSGTRSYYVTRFIEDDRCSAEVDFVLADLRDANDPVAALRRWGSAHDPSPLGVAALGIWVRGDTLRGLNVPASPERQARYFERHLSLLLSDTLSVRPPAVFVFRWRDVRHAYAGTAQDLDQPYLQRYGLYAADGTERPALRVVAGIFTGRQFAFAFEPGTSPRSPTPWPTLVGWGVLAALGIFYALSPRFRHMIPRYFQARFFFREAVREGRDVLLGASAVLLTALGVATGLVAFVIADAVRATDAFMLAVRWLPTPTQSVMATLLARPVVFVIALGCIYVVGLLVWTVILSILTRRKYQVTPAQVLMLVVWPRWPLLVVMVAAMAAATLPETHFYLIGGLAAVWVLLSVAAFVRTLIDLIAVARMPMWMLPAAALLHPAVVASGVLAVVVLDYLPEAEFIWHAVVHQ